MHILNHCGSVWTHSQCFKCFWRCFFPLKADSYLVFTCGNLFQDWLPGRCRLGRQEVLGPWATEVLDMLTEATWAPGATERNCRGGVQLPPHLRIVQWGCGTEWAMQGLHGELGGSRVGWCGLPRWHCGENSRQCNPGDMETWGSSEQFKISSSVATHLQG